MLDGRARDLLTGADGRAVVLDTCSVTAEVDFMDGREIRSIRTQPADSRLAALVGAPASAGLRDRVGACAPDLRNRRSVLHLLLDEIPVATLISGYALAAQGFFEHRRVGREYPDLCAGWAVGGTLMEGMQETGQPPVAPGPDAPPVERDDDPLGWHTVPPSRRAPCGDDAGSTSWSANRFA